MDLTNFEASLKKWVQTDTQIRLANQQIRDMRKEQDKLTTYVCEFIREHKLENRKIETTDSKIEFYEKKSHTSLSYGFLEKYLADIIPDEKNVEYIVEYLKSKRETKKTPDLKRVFKKGMKRGTAKAHESSRYESDSE
jgi:phage shock protein A